MSKLNYNQLKQFYKKCQKDKLIAIDTEFYRVDTYYPKLCLIQLANTEQIILLDPIENKIDLGYLNKILNNTKIKKIFHAARQDIEIFFNIFNRIPRPVIDTQIFLMAIGYPHSTSYAKACKDLLKIEIDKNNQFIDWRKRPLDNAKKTYAINDVKYLIPLYKIIKNQCKENFNLSKYYRKILSKNTFADRGQNAWKKIRFYAKNELEIKNLKKFSYLREKLAMKKNIPVKRVMTDDEIKIISRDDKKMENKNLLKKLDIKLTN